MSYVICAELLVRAGTEPAVVEAMRAMVPISRAEDGCLDYQALRSADDPRRFLFFERWSSEEAWQRHTETDDFERWVRGVIVPATESRDRKLFAEVTADGTG
jgi:quinol monooxygenase YgiN